MIYEDKSPYSWDDPTRESASPRERFIVIPHKTDGKWSVYDTDRAIVKKVLDDKQKAQILADEWNDENAEDNESASDAGPYTAGMNLEYSGPNMESSMSLAARLIHEATKLNEADLWYIEKLMLKLCKDYGGHEDPNFTGDGMGFEFDSPSSARDFAQALQDDKEINNTWGIAKGNVLVKGNTVHVKKS